MSYRIPRATGKAQGGVTVPFGVMFQAETQEELDKLLPSVLDRAFKGELWKGVEMVFKFYSKPEDRSSKAFKEWSHG